MHWSQRVALVYLGAIALMVWGYGIGAHKIWPYSVFKEIKDFVKKLLENLMYAVAMRLIDSPGTAQAAMDPNGWLAEVITYLLTPRLLGPNRFCGRSFKPTLSR